MKKAVCLFMLSFLISLSGSSQEYLKAERVRIGFFSEAPVEDIVAVSEDGIAAATFGDQQIQVKIPISSFQFEKELMQEHFNEKFMESHLHPFAGFTGHIEGLPAKWDEGEFKVQLHGVLEIHGVSRDRIIPGNFKIRNGEAELTTAFKVACQDHNIRIPRILWQNVAEVIDVSVRITFNKTN